MSNYQSRDEIPAKYKWNLENIFANLNEWQKTYEMIERNIDKLKTYKGLLSQDARYLLEFLELETETSQLFERVSVYARMREDENTKDSERQSLVQRISPLSLKFSSAVSFFSNEILAIPQEKWDDFTKMKRFPSIKMH